MNCIKFIRNWIRLIEFKIDIILMSTFGCFNNNLTKSKFSFSAAIYNAVTSIYSEISFKTFIWIPLEN